jgi:hypothetical protein
VGLVTFDERTVEELLARFRPRQLHRLMLCLQRAPAGASTDLMEQIAATANSRAVTSSSCSGCSTRPR